MSNLKSLVDIQSFVKIRNKSASSAIFLLFPVAWLTHTLLTLRNFDAVSIAFGILMLLIILTYIAYQAFQAYKADSALIDSLRSVASEDRLDELERLKRRDMVTPEEYTAKRQEILKDL
jgi:hypothetical protein